MFGGKRDVVGNSDYKSRRVFRKLEDRKGCGRSEVVEHTHTGQPRPGTALVHGAPARATGCLCDVV